MKFYHPFDLKLGPTAIRPARFRQAHDFSAEGLDLRSACMLQFPNSVLHP